jgi:hypothetical protein
MNDAATGGGTTKNWNSRSPMKPRGMVDVPPPGVGAALGLGPGEADADGAAESEGVADALPDGDAPALAEGLALAEGEALPEADALGEPEASGDAVADCETLGDGVARRAAWLAAPWVSARNVARMLMPTGMSTDRWRIRRGRYAMSAR